MGHGAERLRKAILRYSEGIAVTRTGPMIHLATDRFELTVRVCSAGEWWPVALVDSQGTQIAEITRNGRKLVNIQVQNALIEMANNWGKSIDAQRVIKEIPSIIA